MEWFVATALDPPGLNETREDLVVELSDHYEIVKRRGSPLGLIGDVLD